MKVLLTGITGLVGGSVARHLRSAGHEVIGLSRRSAGDSHAQCVQADLGAEGFLEEVVRASPPCDQIVHAAACLDKGLTLPAISIVNCLGIQQIAALSVRWGNAPVIYISSLYVIGTPRAVPIDEQHPAAPTTSYHASKLFGEHIMAAASKAGVPTTSLRLTAPVGPAMPPNRILPTFVRRAMAGLPIELAGQGTRRQDYVDVGDVAAAVAQCLSRPLMGEVLNIGSGKSVSNLELARSCIEVCRSNSDIRFSGRVDAEEGLVWEVSIGRAAKLIDYTPSYSLRDTITSLVEAYAGDHS